MNIHKKQSLIRSSIKLSNAIVASTVFASTLVISSYSYAQDEDVSSNARLDKLEEVIVTGSRTGRTLIKIPGSVSIISPEQIKRDMNMTADFTALLGRTIPGMAQSQQQLENRGETLRGRRALRLLDGVPQGSPLRDGSRNAIFTDLGIIERVEVINGPSSTEGIGAAGGIINYRTKTPTEMGTEVEVSGQLRSQFETDSDSWRTGFNILHKNEVYDFLLATSFAETGIAYDGSGETIAIGTSGSDRDSESDNLFIKIGADFGGNDSQRIEFSHSRFEIECKCNYSRDFGTDTDSPPFGFNFNNKIPITSKKEAPPGERGSFNDFIQSTASYTHDDLFGGSLFIQYYQADQQMRFEVERTLSKQDPEFAPFTLDENGFPVGDLPLAEQSEILTDKIGVRSAWGTEKLFGIDGLGLEVGGDFVNDEAEQRLAIQDNGWVPPIEYTSFAPFAQASYDVGNLTLTAGVRNEDGELEVDDYVTSWANDRRPVQGGTVNYNEVLLNAGAIWRVFDQWAVFASYSEGFDLPNVGIPLRNVSCSNDTPESGDPENPEQFPFGGTQPDGCPNDPPIGVDDIVGDLGAIVIDNREIGISWTGRRGGFSASVYENRSDFGQSLDVDSDGKLVLSRQPEEIRGVEFDGSYNVTDWLKVSAIYSHITGETVGPNGKIDKELGIFDVPADKLVTTADWRYAEKGSIVLSATTTFDKETNEGEPDEETVNGYTLLDLTVNYQISNATISLGITNLEDETYLLTTSQVLFYKNYTRGRGREFTLGYTMTF